MPWHMEQGGGTCTASEWAVIKDDDGTTAGCHASQTEAADQMAALYAAEAEMGLLPERWTSVEGIAFSERLPGGRDFTATQWSWRDPAVSTLPLMLQTETEVGHFGAVLAGFIEELALNGSTVEASGRFYDNEAGIRFRDMLLGGRSFGVSVDPTENVEVELICEEEDDEGFCMAGRAVFHSYEIGGLTGTPFPGFAQAAIQLDPAVTPAEGLVAAAHPTFTVHPPAHWFDEQINAAFFPLMPVVAASSWTTPPAALFDRVPMEIPKASVNMGEDPRHVYGYIGLFNSCHIGLPGCEEITPGDDMAFFHLGEVETDEGWIPCGRITMSGSHAPVRGSMAQAIAVYDNTSTQAAWIRAGEDEHGIWFAGVLCPDLEEDQVRRLRGSGGLSGDWRPVHGKLRLCMAHTVNLPGYPIPRVAVGMRNGLLTGLVASAAAFNHDCGCEDSDQEERLARLEATVSALGLNSQAAEALAASL